MKKGFSGILVLIVVLMVAVGAGAYYLGTQKSGGTPLVQSPSPVPNGTGETANPDLIGANWKTYTNSELGFEFKYPAGWIVEPDREGLITTRRNYYASNNRGASGLNGTCLFTVDSLKRETNENLRIWLKRLNREQEGNQEAQNISDITVDSREGIKATHGGTDSTIDQSAYLPLTPNEVLFIYLNCGVDISPKGLNDFYQILSTFKFTE